MKQRYRVQTTARFQEIRQTGKSYTSKSLVLCALPNALPYCRFGFSINKRIGNAVVRNRIKRQLRESMRLRMGEIEAGWDIVVIARHSVRNLDYHAMDADCARLLGRAHLLVSANQAGKTQPPAAGTDSAPDTAKPETTGF